MNNFYLIFIISILFVFTSDINCQYRTKIPTSSVIDTRTQNEGGNIFNFFNSDNFSMNHSFGMSMNSFGGISKSYGTYTNNMNLKLNDKLMLKSLIYFVQPSNIQNLTSPMMNNPSIYYDANLNYKISENIMFQLSLSSSPNYYRYNLSPYINSYAR